MFNTGVELGNDNEFDSVNGTNCLHHSVTYSEDYDARMKDFTAVFTKVTGCGYGDLEAVAWMPCNNEE